MIDLEAIKKNSNQQGIVQTTQYMSPAMNLDQQNIIDQLQQELHRQKMNASNDVEYYQQKTHKLQREVADIDNEKRDIQ